MSLEEIARQTKVTTSRIRALERNDLSTWPGGVFRRGFVREYAAIVGLDPDQVVAAFAQAFPEEIDGVVIVHQPAGDGSLRLVLAEERSGWRPVATRVGAAATDLMAPIVLALPSGLLGGSSAFWIVLAVVAVLYLTVSTLVLGMTPGMRMMRHAGPRPWRTRALTGLRAITLPPSTRASADEPPLDGKISHAHR